LLLSGVVTAGYIDQAAAVLKLSVPMSFTTAEVQHFQNAKS